MVEWLAGNRIRGTSAERTTTAGIGKEVGGWVEVGRTTLGSTTKPITVSSIPDKRYYMILVDMNKSGNATSNIRVGNTTIDPNNNYADRGSYNGAADGTPRTSVSTHELATASAGVGDFIVGYVANLSAKEKLMQYYWVYNGAINAGTAPERAEKVGKWTNGGVSAVIDTIQLYNSQSGNYLSGSEVVVLGWDESDTHTDNFWEPLGSTTLATAGNNIEVTFTAKKYLMVKLYRKPTGAANARWTFNNDGGANYAQRTSSRGGSDSTSIDQNYFTQYTYSNDDPSYSSTIIVNTAGAEKLGIQHEVNRRVSGADNYPVRSESFFKWDNTSDQITTIDITNSKSGSYDVGSIIEVWGHD